MPWGPDPVKENRNVEVRRPGSRAMTRSQPLPKREMRPRFGMPERFAQAALGHNSKAIHRAYTMFQEYLQFA
jgi:hypothetical protein